MPDPQSAPINPFVYTDTPTNYASTPEQVAQMRALSQYNMQGMPPAKSWAGVLAHALGGFTGNQQMQQANQLQQAGLGQLAKQQGGIGQQGGGGGLLGSQAPNAAGGESDPVSAMGAAIASRESAGAANPYTVDGPKSKNGDYPSGKYQVMGANIPIWTQEALGQSLTREQFKASPQAQEAVFRSKMGGYLQTMSPQDAASKWISGKPLAQALASGNRPDVNGTTPAAYSSAVVNALRGGGGQQIAQASPTTGMTGRQYGAIMANPWLSQDQKNQYQHAQTPQLAQTATGALVPFTPGQQPGGQIAPGALHGTIGTPNANVPVYQPTDAQGNPIGQGPYSNQGNLGSTVAGAANLGNTAGEIGNDLAAVNAAKEGLPAANARLGQIQSFRALGQDVDSGALPMWQTLAARFGVQFGDNPTLGRQQAYQAMAESILGNKDDSFKASIPGLSTTPEGRQMIADYLENQARYQQKLGQIAAFGKGTATQRRQQMLGVEAPQSYTSQGGAQQPQQPPPGNSPNAPGARQAGAPTSAPAATSGQAAAAQFQEGQTATNPQTGKKAIFRGGKWQVQ